MNILYLYKNSHFAREWLRDSLCSAKPNGKRSNRSCPNPNGTRGGVRLKVTAKSLREFSGFSEPARVGAIYPKTLESVPVSAGNAFAVGRNRESGCDYGAPSSLNWTSAESSTGRKVFWTGVSLPLKKGRRSRQNQARQGHEVDGGGRRPGCSFGKSTDQCLSGRSQTGRVHARCGFGSARGSWPAAKTTLAGDCRSGLRQRSLAGSVAQPGPAADRSASQEPASPNAQRWTNSAPLSQALEGRTYFCLAGQLPQIGRPLRSPLAHVSRLLSHRLCPDYIALSS